MVVVGIIYLLLFFSTMLGSERVCGGEKQIKLKIEVEEWIIIESIGQPNRAPCFA